VPKPERPLRQLAVERALDIGWSKIGSGALEAAVAAVRHMEDEPLLNAGIGACLNSDGVVELDAGVMEGSELHAGGAACLRDVRHPIDLAVAVMRDGRHVLLAADGASRFARDRGVEMCDPSIFITDRKRQALLHGADTVGAVARDADGHLAVAVSTGGINGKLPGRIGDSPIPGAGFYADDRFGAVCGTGLGEAFIRLGLAHLVVVELQHGIDAASVAKGAVEHLGKALKATGGVIVLGRDGAPEAAFNTAAMPFAVAQ
jgi:beta-aspartyl-peptidase (threonine type)